MITVRKSFGQLLQHNFHNMFSLAGLQNTLHKDFDSDGNQKKTAENRCLIRKTFPELFPNFSPAIQRTKVVTATRKEQTAAIMVP